MEKFTQLLQPVADNLYLSALVALIPIVFYLVALAGFKVKGWLTGLLTLIVAITKIPEMEMVQEHKIVHSYK